ncbi:hypothetical protein OEA41_007230 [Lepraria neglecta]|uniref:Uncharacterized protein n=1 Tax=Lepraria neglecta TaxID=209136 RepID=A0AAD9ZCE6_9LECA|nr:hypothetical protein OEA41_007230 [Lepraria neglecta]
MELQATVPASRGCRRAGGVAGNVEAKKAAETVSFVLARAGEVRDYGIDLDAERTSAAIIGQDMSTNANGSSAGLAFDGQAMLQTTMDLYEPSRRAPRDQASISVLEARTFQRVIILSFNERK